MATCSMSGRHLQRAFKFYKTCCAADMKEFVLLSGLGHNLDSEWFGLEETLSLSSHSNGQGQLHYPRLLWMGRCIWIFSLQVLIFCPANGAIFNGRRHIFTVQTLSDLALLDSGGTGEQSSEEMREGGSSLVDGVLLLSPFFCSLMNATNRSRNSGASSGRAVITEFCWDPGPVEHRPANEAPPASAELNVPAGSRASLTFIT